MEKSIEQINKEIAELQKQKEKLEEEKQEELAQLRPIKIQKIAELVKEAHAKVAEAEKIADE